MSSANAKLAEVEVATQPENNAPAGFKMFNRIVDWITNDRTQLINITDRINDVVRKSGIRDGLVHLQSLHTTTSVFLNEWQDALLHDMRRLLTTWWTARITGATMTPSTPTVSARMPIRTYAE